MNSSTLRRGLSVAVGVLLLGNASALATIRRDEPRFRGAPESLARVLPQLMHFVEATRGLKFTHTVVVSTLTPDDFAPTGPRPTAKEKQAFLAQESAFYRALGLLPVNAPPIDLSPSALQDRIAGVYDSDANRLLARDVAPSPFGNEVIVHELTHALDDQHFDLSRRDLLVHNDEAATSFQALVEGDARWVERQYVASLSASDQELARQGRDAAGAGADLPPKIEMLMSYPYGPGADFIDALRQGHGASEVDHAFRRPPTTSAEILEPDRYLHHVAAADVARPKPEGSSFRRGNLGEVYLLLMLIGPSDAAASRAAATGWGGDRYVAFTTGAKACVAADLSVRAPGDAAALGDALGRWAHTLPEARVDPTKDGFQIRSCVPKLT